MLPPLATLDEFQARLGRELTDGLESSRAEAALEDASTLVREETRQTWVDEDNNPDAPDTLVRVVLAAARRDFTNPDGVSMETRTVGPFTESVQHSKDVSTVYLTDEEKSLCQRYRTSQTSGLWTLSTTRDDCYDETLWLNDSYGVEPFPIGYDKHRWWL